MITKFRTSGGMHFLAVFLCAVFALGIIGLGEWSESEASRNGSCYHSVFLGTNQPHNGQDRADESAELLAYVLHISQHIPVS
jgi:hypothetical protein